MFLSITRLAVLKVVFDQVDGLKPYGLMLGDDSTGNRENPPVIAISGSIEA